jgi:sorting nexin-9/18/33
MPIIVVAINHLRVSDISRQNLMEAVRATGDTYHAIGKLFEEQPKLDWEPLGDVLHLYKGIISSFPDILTVHKVSEMKSHILLQQLSWTIM